MNRARALEPDTCDVVAAAERRFGLRSQPVWTNVIVEAADALVRTGAAASLSDVAFRLSHAAATDAVVRHLREAASIVETYFMRGREALQALVAALAPTVAARRRGAARQLRVWSAGCATGEEAYSLAMVLKAAFPDFSLQIIGSDINSSALAAARAGTYRARSLRAVTEWERSTWFTQSGDVWGVSPVLRACVRFVQHDLLEDPVPSPELGLGGFDAVVCRNVLIYVASERIPRLMARLSAACSAEGLLLLAPAEFSAARHAAEFKPLRAGLLVRTRSRPPRPATLQVPARAAPSAAERPASATPRLPSRLDAGELLDGARRAADRGELSKARALVDAANASEPQRVDGWFLSAELYLAAQAFERAAEDFARVLALDPECVAAEFGRARALLSAGAAAQARAHLERAASLASRLPPSDMVFGMEITAAALARMVREELAQTGEVP